MISLNPKNAAGNSNSQIKTPVELGYPQDHRRIEMTLVKMLGEDRCWNDILSIHDALDNIRKQAISMDNERKMFAQVGTVGASAKEYVRNAEREMHVPDDQRLSDQILNPPLQRL